MSLDWESHRILDRSGLCRALVFTLARHVVVKTRIDDAAAKVRTFDSMEKFEGWVRQRRWTLERARHFS